MENGKNNQDDTIKVIFFTILFLLFLLIISVVIPSAIRLIFSFFDLVVFGEQNFSEFIEDFPYHSYDPVITFYKSLYERLTH